MKRSLSRIAALSLALGLATSTAPFASADILVPGDSPVPQDPLYPYRELIEKKYGPSLLPALTLDSQGGIIDKCIICIKLCHDNQYELLSGRTGHEKKKHVEEVVETFVKFYNFMCGNAMRSTPHRIYIARDKEANAVNLYVKTKNDLVAEYVGKLITEEGKIKIKLQKNDGVELPNWEAPFVVIGPRQDAADFMSAIDKPPVGACYLDGARVDLLAALALSRVIPGKEFQDAPFSDPGIFMFFPNEDVLMDAISNANEPYMKNKALMDGVKKKAEKNLYALGKELLAVKNAAIFDEKAAWTTYGDSSKDRRLRACRAYQKVLDRFLNTGITTDAVFEGYGPFYTLMRALWGVAKTPNVEPDDYPDEELLSLMKMLPVVNTPKSTAPTGESYGVEDIEVIKMRIQHIAEEYGLTEKVQEAAARFVQALQEKRMLDSSYNTGVNAYYAHLLSYLLEYASTCGIFANVSLDPKQLLLGAIVSNLKEQKWGGEITTEKDEKEKREKKLTHEVLRKRARNKYKKR